MNVQPVRTVRLSGPLGDRFGYEFKLAIRSPGEAIRALCAIVPGFEKFLTESGEQGIDFYVFAGRRNITKDELLHPSGRDVIRIAPTLRGKKSGLLASIVGVVLIVVGVFLMFTPFAAFAPYVIGAGVGLLAVGVAQMLAPAPPGAEKDRGDSRANAVFNGPVNTQAQGNPVPLFYGGPMTIGSAVISASISVKDGVYIPQPGGSGYGGGSGSWAQRVREAIGQTEMAE